jgi:3-phosphoshikimate 1-carboxyvinyltransferase
VPPHTLKLQPRGALRGTLRVPGDKSISHRYVMFGSIARGDTRITGLAPGADVASTVAVFRALGVAIEAPGPHALHIHGRGRAALRPAPAPLDAGNSGTTMRLMAGILAGCPFQTTLTGDDSLTRRPMRRVIEPLSAMGARIASQNGAAPLKIDGGALHAIDWTSPVASAQVKSAIMLAALAAPGRSTIREPLATRDHTERAFPAFGLRAEAGDRTVSVEGVQDAVAPEEELRVPGDPSSAAVWAAAAAALPGSHVRIEGVCLNPLRVGFVAALRRLGARLEVEPTGVWAGEPVGTLDVMAGDRAPITIGAAEIPALIDELPVLAACAAHGGRLDVSGAGELRVKESDRISALVAGFRALGVNADERPDGFVIDGSHAPRGGHADAAGDHRLVMAFALVGLGATGPTTIAGADVVAVSYPGFEADLERLLA